MRFRLIVVLGFTALAVALAGRSKPVRATTPKELNFLLPYVVKQEKRYMRLRSPFNPKHASYRAYSDLTLRGVSRNDVVRMLVKKLPASAGWQYDGCSMSSTAMLMPEPTSGLSFVMVGDDPTETYVGAVEELSPFQVVLIRAEHPGVDPFESHVY